MDWNEGKKPLPPTPKDGSIKVLAAGVGVCLAIICGCLLYLANS